MRSRNISTILTGLVLATMVPVGAAHAGKGGKPSPIDLSPCSPSPTGEMICPFDDDEPGEYTENFYSGKWGTAGGSGVITSNTTAYWDAHVVYKLDRKPTDTGVQDVVLQDTRVADARAYSLNLSTLTSAIKGAISINVTVGSCAAKPDANCISVVDFDAQNHPGSGGYMTPVSLTERKMAFNPSMMTGKQATKFLLHEGGHAFGLSHKHNPNGVMSYYLIDRAYSNDETAALRLAYSGGGRQSVSRAQAQKVPPTVD